MLGTFDNRLEFFYWFRMNKGHYALLYFRTPPLPLLLLMIRHEEMRLNAYRNPKVRTKVQ